MDQGRGRKKQPRLALGRRMERDGQGSQIVFVCSQAQLCGGSGGRTEHGGRLEQQKCPVRMDVISLHTRGLCSAYKQGAKSIALVFCCP